jgi:hypothetical protein
MSFDFGAVVAPFRMQPGLRRLAAGTAQLTPLRPGDAAWREKLAVLRRHADQALLTMPGFDDRPALRALCEHAAREHPQAFRWDGTRAHALHLGWQVDGDAASPPDAPDAGIAAAGAPASPDAATGACLRALPARWRLAGLLSLAFHEDFAILDATSGRVPWLAVCLPSHWAPEEKVGRHFSEIHAPVADNDLLIAASSHLMRLVTSGDHWERFVWTIAPRGSLDAHPRRLDPASGWPGGASMADVAARAWFRTERQTFVPVPAARQSVFTIHVATAPLAQAVATRERAAQVHAAVASMSSAVLAYRGLAQVQPQLLEWLSARAAT